MTYAEKLKDPRWKLKRLEILMRDKHTCKICFKRNIKLHVHHMIYLENTEPWDYSNDLLLTVCEKHHKYIHDNFEIYTVNDNQDSWPAITMSNGLIRQGRDAQIIGWVDK
jgi:5-methylcytosine-specific restriction endonuclease McrA